MLKIKKLKNIIIRKYIYVIKVLISKVSYNNNCKIQGRGSGRVDWGEVQRWA